MSKSGDSPNRKPSGGRAGSYSSRRASCAPGTVCVCNLVTRDVIVAAVKRGCRTLDRVSAATTAGAGQCGGTCRPEIARIVEETLAGEAASKSLGSGDGGGEPDPSSKK